MEYKELMNALADLNMKVAALEETYMDNGGEVTDETEALTSEISVLRDFLSTDGVDVLGRWLRAKEDEKKAFKAEKDYLTRKMQNTDRTIDFIKGRLAAVMDACGMDKAKGLHGYSFTRTTSTTTSVDKDMLSALYGKRLEDAKQYLGIPDYITLTLGASASAFKTAADAPAEDEQIFITSSKDTITFRKPKADKE